MNKQELDEKLSNREEYLKDVLTAVGGRKHPNAHRHAMLGQILLQLGKSLSYARDLWSAGWNPDCGIVIDGWVEPMMRAATAEYGRWMEDFKRLEMKGYCIYVFSTKEKTYGFACYSWAVAAQKAQQDIFQGVGPVREEWESQEICDRLRLAGEEGAEIGE